jgi:hypothetical protein
LRQLKCCLSFLLMDENLISLKFIRTNLSGNSFRTAIFRKRALLIANAINNTIAFMCNTSAHVKTSAYANAYAIANMNIKPSTSANAIAIIVRHIDYIKTSSRVKANINKKDNNEAKETSNKKPEVNATEEVYENVIEYFIKYAGWAKEHKIYKRPDLELPAIVNELESLGTQIPQIEEPKERHQEFAQQLIKMLLTAFHLTPEMVDLSKQEIHSLDNYLYSTRLLIECEHAAVRRTTEVWNQIEDRLLRKSRKQN